MVELVGCVATLAAVQAGFTVNVCALDVPPPGAGLTTVIENEFATVKSLAGIEAVNCVPETKVVVRGEPLKLTTEFETKFVPLTVIVKVASPTVLLDGEMLVVVGSGLVTLTVGCPPVGAGN